MCENDIGLLIKQISNLVRMRVDTELSAYDLTFSQLLVMRCVDEAGGEMTQKAIEQALNVSHPTVVGLISRLEKNGYVLSLSGDGKQKSKRIQITERGRQQKIQLAENRKRTDELLLHGFSESEKETLWQLLNRMYLNIQCAETDQVPQCGQCAKGPEGESGKPAPVQTEAPGRQRRQETKDGLCKEEDVRI